MSRAKGAGPVRVWAPFDDVEVPEGVELDVYDGSAEPPASIGEVEVYVVPYMTGARDTELMARMPRLRLAQTLTAGVDSYLPYVPDGVALAKARGVHDASTAELAVGLAIAAQRGLPEFVRAQAAGRWAPESRLSLADQTVLLVGYGSIGQAIERRLLPFECEVRKVARTSRDGVTAIADVGDLLPSADVVILILPMTDETVGLVDARFLSRMRDGALLVNVARGQVVDTDALVEEVAAGRLRAAMDVTDPEPLPEGHPLWSLPGVLITPHVGGDSSAFLPRAKRLVTEQLRRYVAGDELLNVVSGGY